MTAVLAQLLWVALLPALFAAAVHAAAAFVFRREHQARWRIAAIASGGGFLIAYAGRLGLPRFPAIQANEWLFWFALGAALLGLVLRTDAWWRWCVRFGAVGLVLLLLLRSLMQNGWTWQESSLALLALSGLVVCFWDGLERAASRWPAGSTLPSGVLIILTGVAVAVGLSGSAQLGELAGALSATIGVALLASWIWPARPLLSGVVPVLALVGGAILCNGKFYADLPSSAGVWLLLAPQIAQWGTRSRAGLAHGRRPYWTYLFWLAIPVAIAVAIALRHFEPDANGPGY